MKSDSGVALPSYDEVSDFLGAAKTNKYDDHLNSKV
jgi:hypothetical protein